MPPGQRKSRGARVQYTARGVMGHVTFFSGKVTSKQTDTDPQFNQHSD